MTTTDDVASMTKAMEYFEICGQMESVASCSAENSEFDFWFESESALDIFWEKIVDLITIFMAEGAYVLASNMEAANYVRAIAAVKCALSENVDTLKYVLLAFYNFLAQFHAQYAFTNTISEYYPVICTCKLGLDEALDTVLETQMNTDPPVSNYRGIINGFCSSNNNGNGNGNN
uniref:Uncharacterized protein n=1 Tax=Strombidium inclinatum TaxID=197538 RepID=A0A7S3IFH0_9SPIT|mmetsp:Transcript_15810/g.24336  ORF Transcript_15810/g.24336 Transcript_15810/m.24336 type:complete len:175 (+) Transcript_15810:42-566(+)|eukprot:CAMPEP_0170490932 /NCGR_PEP_ID=MMETSP0208-20121228/10064_1 /TAXON_ID=197538 /ORGANISM="Strombidium inclinatum, Strain S3" /LENGTH=174 /DNA_ID=CAMNT_0010766417 /DNA_START=18 /DNA_END=542 /DNA_ORIENTATION=+